VGQALLSDKEDLAEQRARAWMDTYPDRFYLELHRAGREGDESHLHAAVALAERLQCPVVATNDVRFLSAKEFEAHEARVCIREGRTLDEGAIYAKGRLAILVPKGSPLIPDGSLHDLEKAIDDGRLRRLAIANPEHAPYGKAARETLEALQLWERVENRLVVGENVSQAAQFAATGAADAGLVAYGLALSPHLEKCCDHAPVPADRHRPLRQRGALIKGAGEAAARLYAFILGPQGRAILERHGFGVPAR
jgi:molybdate transport system substrate-binding protein